MKKINLNILQKDKSELVTEARDILKESLKKFITKEGPECLGPNWKAEFEKEMKLHRNQKNGKINWEDTRQLLSIIIGNWDKCFKSALEVRARTWVHELKDFLNRWAHEERFPLEDINRFLDTTSRLCQAMKDPDAIKSINKMKQDIDSQLKKFPEQSHHKENCQKRLYSPKRACLTKGDSKKFSEDCELSTERKRQIRFQYVKDFLEKKGILCNI